MSQPEIPPEKNETKPVSPDSESGVADTAAAVFAQAETPDNAKKKRRASPFLVILLLSMIVTDPPILAGLAAFLPGPLEAQKIVIIPRGAPVNVIAATLEKEGVAPNPLMFRLAARLLASDNLQAGEYQFEARQNLVDIVLQMRDGRSIIRRFTVVEGLTSHEIVEQLNDTLALTGEIDAIPDEGSLLPETYNYSYGDSRLSLIKRMQKAARDQLNELWSHRASGLPLKSPQEAVIVASMVEKETGKKAEERPRVAGVFYNRLRQGMRLQSDPTVVYALTNGRDPLPRELTRNDLATASPYNTYMSDGLPPKPIANPGRASLQAALNPEVNSFLYFVADGTGGHAFASDLNEHNRNVQRWQSLARP